MGSPVILLAEQDPRTREFLASNLAADGYRIAPAPDRAKALALLSVDQPALIIADLDGQTLALLDAIRSGRQQTVDPDTPMIVLSRGADDLHRVRVLDRGGDDVITKPFSYPELRARVAALLRRAACRRHPRRLQVGPLMIDLTARRVVLGEQPVALSGTEYELLVALASDPHRVFTRQQLLRDVWGYQTPSRTVDSHACRLRTKLSAHPQQLVICVRSIGYRFCDPVGSPPAIMETAP